MPNVVITVGGRQFEVACQDGEESFLEAAARVLDDEAKLWICSQMNVFSDISRKEF